MRKIAQRTTSLETPVGDEGDAELGDFIQNQDTPDPADVVSGIMAKESLGKVLEAMDERERKVVELRFGLKGDHPRTLAEVSSRFKREPGAHPPDRGQGPREDQGSAGDPGHEGVGLRAGIAATPLTRILGRLQGNLGSVDMGSADRAPRAQLTVDTTLAAAHEHGCVAR